MFFEDSFKEIELSVIRVEDPKTKPANDPKEKPLQPNQSSRRMERRLNNGQIKVETSKEMGNLSTDSPRGSRIRRRSKEMGSLVTGERKALVPSSLSWSPKHSPKKVLSRNAQNSNNMTGVSRFRNKNTVRKPQREQPSWKDVQEKTLHVVEPNAEEKTPGPIKNVICVTDLSPPSFSSHEDKSLEHAQKGSLTAQPSTLSTKRNLRRTLSCTSTTNSLSSRPPSANQNLRRTLSEIQAANSPPSRPSSAKQNLRRNWSGIQSANSRSSRPPTVNQNLRRTWSGILSPTAGQNLRRTRSGIQYANSPPSHPPTAKQNLRRTQSRIQSANSPSSHPPTAKQNFRRTQSGIQSANPPSSYPPTAKQNLRRTQFGIQTSNSPPSPRKKGSRGTQLGTRTSLASLTTAETDLEKQTSDLKKQCKNDPRKGGSISLKDENVPGKELTFSRGKVVDLHHVDCTPTRLKFRRSALGESQNGKGDAIKETPGKEEANTAQLLPSPAKQNSTHTEYRTLSIQSCLSWPPSPKNEGLRGTQPRIRIARSYSLASMSALGETSSEIVENDVENLISELEKEHKNRPPKDGPSSLKDEQSLGQKLTDRRGNLVELHPVDCTATRLKFEKRVLGDSQNGEGDAGSKTVEKKEVIASQLSLLSAKKNLGHTQNGIQSSRVSWPPSPMKKILRHTEFELGTTITRSCSCISSLVLLSMNGDETDTEKQTLDLEHEFKDMHEMDGKTSSKEECDRRRLKFNQRESLFGDSNQNDSGDVGRKILVKQEINDGTKTESKDVVSKHRDVVRKNSGSLFNNIIKETVSKLIKTKKSQVKALVGAFETVISLQDTKPAY